MKEKKTDRGGDPFTSCKRYLPRRRTWSTKEKERRFIRPHALLKQSRPAPRLCRTQRQECQECQAYHAYQAYHSYQAWQAYQACQAWQEGQVLVKPLFG